MSPKMKKATFGFQNRTDLLTRPTGSADHQDPLDLSVGRTVAPSRTSLASPGSSAVLPGLLSYSKLSKLSACLYKQSRPSTNVCRMNK